MRQTQVRLFATPTTDDENPEPDVALVDARSTTTPPGRTRPWLGVKRDILDRLLDAPVSPEADVFDMTVARRALLNSYRGPSNSGALPELIRGVMVERVTPTGTGFQPGDDGDDRVRYVRLRAGS